MGTNNITFPPWPIEWWEKYDPKKPPQFLQPPWAAAPSLKDFSLPDSPMPEPPPAPVQGPVLHSKFRTYSGTIPERTNMRVHKCNVVSTPGKPVYANNRIPRFGSFLATTAAAAAIPTTATAASPTRARLCFPTNWTNNSSSFFFCFECVCYLHRWLFVVL